MKKILFIIFMSILFGNAHASDLNKTDIHGFISQGFMISDRNNYYADTEDGTFQFNETGINFSNQLNDRLRIGMQFFSRDLGDIGNNEITVDWAVADYRWKDWLGLRTGRIKNRCGFYGYTRDIDMLRTSVFLPQSVYYEGVRETTNALDGVGIYGYVHITDSNSIDYQINYGNYIIDAEQGLAKLLDNQTPVKVLNVESGDLLLMNLEWNTMLKGLKLGGTLALLDVKTESVSKLHPLLLAYNIPRTVTYPLMRKR